MFAKMQERWRRLKRPLEGIVIILSLLVLLVLIILIIFGYFLRWDWTGLTPSFSPSHPNNNIYLPGKTLWDWLQLLIIPAVLAIGGYLFNFTTTRTEQESTKQRDQTQRDLTLDNQREAALQTYIDKISELILEKNLCESQPDDEVRTIARVRTLTTLPRLDDERKASVLQFLYESKLIEKDECIVKLSGADMSGVILSKADLRKADLSETLLREADLSGADLSGAIITQLELDTARSLANAILPDGSTHP